VTAALKPGRVRADGERMRSRVTFAVRSLVLVVVLAAAAVQAAPAAASKAITHNASNVRMKVRLHRAIVSYTDRHGVRHHILAWGAINASKPVRGRRQRRFKLDYTGGIASFGHAMWKYPDSCKHFANAAALQAAMPGQPKLPMVIDSCRAGDGTFWALQAWKRIIPHGGLHKSDYAKAPLELHLSHWSGPLPVLWLKTDWVYNGKYDHLWGQFTYRGHPVYAFHTNHGDPTDGWGRNVYVDTYDSKWGKGWWRLQAFLTHRPKGNFCVGTYNFGHSQPGMGSEYRATIMGPGVTPIVRWTGPSPGPYDAAADAIANAEQRQLAPKTDSCYHTH
jgi:hypothetical protein